MKTRVLLECCKNCGHSFHQDICGETTFRKKCPCKTYVLEKFSSLDEIYQEYERLIFQYEKVSKKRITIPKESIKNIRNILCINSKTRILKKWMDDIENEN